jgi:lipopolysaccharide/colanic/teichoic acid biosynthesis glycosyltransferase
VESPRDTAEEVFAAFESAVFSSQPGTASLDQPFLDLSKGRARGAFVKRVLDLALAIPITLLLSPVFLLIAIAIKLDSFGPVFFRQPRYGIKMRPFSIWKFRSLQHGAPDPHDRYRMLAHDSRITRVGAFLRRTSLDELPQLFNVIGGSMSLVGPRPLVEWESLASLRTHPERFTVKPGITGLCQVRFRNSGAMAIRWDCDVEYVRKWNPLLDLGILLRTPRCVLRRENIYPPS